MTPAGIIYHRRVRVLEHAAKAGVAKACRTFGASRTAFYRWKEVADVDGLAALIPKTKRAPAMPNATPMWVVEGLRAEAVVRPGGG